jgi:Arc/MetJ-type ribon-helix-helix transcriptional regulator
MSEQIAVRIPDELALSLEELVAHGRFETKAEAVRTALEILIESERRRRAGELIAEGYRRIPQGDAETVASSARQTLRALEAEERELGLEW